MSTQQSLNFDRVLFDSKMAEELRESGMQAAALSKGEALELARQACRVAAMRRPDRTATADDAQRFLLDAKLEPLGSAAGSLFSGREWKFTGCWQKSERVSNHGHQNRVWQLQDVPALEHRMKRAKGAE